jgi:hypothetical protein
LFPLNQKSPQASLDPLVSWKIKPVKHLLQACTLSTVPETVPSKSANVDMCKKSKFRQDFRSFPAPLKNGVADGKLLPNTKYVVFETLWDLGFDESDHSRTGCANSTIKEVVVMAVDRGCLELGSNCAKISENGKSSFQLENFSGPGCNKPSKKKNFPAVGGEYQEGACLIGGLGSILLKGVVETDSKGSKEALDKIQL